MNLGLADILRSSMEVLCSDKVNQEYEARQ